LKKPKHLKAKQNLGGFDYAGYGVELKEPVSITYCYCCAGHFRHHYQNALGIKLKTKKVISSVLNSLGKKPCQFVYEIDK
jgi:hypothetical protein